MSTRLYQVPPNPSPQLQTVLKWIDGYNHWDVDEMLSAGTDDYSHLILPKSLGRSRRNKEQYKADFHAFANMIHDFKVTLHEIIECPGKIFAHGSCTATSSTGHPYANEYNVVFYLVPQPSGPPLINRVNEFVDSKFTVDFFNEEKKRLRAAKHRRSMQMEVARL